MKNSIFKLVTWIAGLYHVILAAIALLLPIEVTSKAFTMALGVNLAVTPQLEFIGKYVGVYMLAFGIMLIMIALNPVRYRSLAYVAVALFGIRFLNRIIFFGALTSTLGMTMTRNIIGSALVFIFFIGILFTMPKKQS